MNVTLRACLGLSLMPVSTLGVAQVTPPTTAANTNASPAGPTLQETQAFLSDKLHEANFHGTSPDFIWNACTIISQNVYGIDYHANMTDVESIVISQWNSSHGNGFLVRLVDDSVKEYAVTDEKKHVPPFSTDASLDFTFSDHNVAERVAKAFERAVLLCGGPKKQPF